MQEKAWPATYFLIAPSYEEAGKCATFFESNKKNRNKTAEGGVRPQQLLCTNKVYFPFEGEMTCLQKICT